MTRVSSLAAFLLLVAGCAETEVRPLDRTFPELLFDFGDRGVGLRTRLVLPIENASDQILTIEEITGEDLIDGPDYHFVISPPLAIAPLGSEPISVEFQAYRPIDDPIEGALILRTNQGDIKAFVRARGVVALAVDPC
jgi:hypothetical protein